MRSLDSGKRRASGNQPGRLTAWLSALVVAFGVALPGAVAHSDAIGVEVIPAHPDPDIEVVQDAAHDVNEMHYTTNELFLVPEETEADILRVKYRHGAHRIAVRVKAAAFTPEMKPKLEGLINRWDDPIYFFLRTTPGQPIQTGLRLYYVDPPDDVLPCEGIQGQIQRRPRRVAHLDPTPLPGFSRLRHRWRVRRIGRAPARGAPFRRSDAGGGGRLRACGRSPGLRAQGRPGVAGAVQPAAKPRSL